MKYDSKKHFISLTASYNKLGDGVIPVIRTLTDCLMVISTCVSERDFFSVIHLPISKDKEEFQSGLEKIDKEECTIALKVLRSLYLKDIKILKNIITSSEHAKLSQKELDKLSENIKDIVVLHIVNIQCLVHKDSAQYINAFGWLAENNKNNTIEEKENTLHEQQQTMQGRKRRHSSTK